MFSRLQMFSRKIGLLQDSPNPLLEAEALVRVEPNQIHAVHVCGRGSDVEPVILTLREVNKSRLAHCSCMKHGIYRLPGSETSFSTLINNARGFTVRDLMSMADDLQKVKHWDQIKKIHSPKTAKRFEIEVKTVHNYLQTDKRFLACPLISQWIQDNRGFPSTKEEISSFYFAQVEKIHQKYILEVLAASDSFFDRYAGADRREAMKHLKRRYDAEMSSSHRAAGILAKPDNSRLNFQYAVIYSAVKHLNPTNSKVVALPGTLYFAAERYGMIQNSDYPPSLESTPSEETLLTIESLSEIMPLRKAIESALKLA